jgi:dienelactone hydrolase
MNPEHPSEYQAELRAATKDAFGLSRIPEGAPEFSTLNSENLPGFIRHKVSYETQLGVRIPAYLLEPTGFPSPWAAVIIVHGCGEGKAGPAGLIDDIHNSLGVYLAEAGFLVLVPDRRGHGELQPVPHYVSPSCGTGLTDARPLLEADAARFGIDLRSLDVFDLLVGVDLVSERQDVTKIGLAGLSGGGIIASYLAGVSDKVSAVVLANSLKSAPTRREIASNDSGLRFPQLPENPRDLFGTVFRAPNPSLSNLTSNPHFVLTALLPPTPLLLQFGDSDPITYLKGGPGVIDFLSDVYLAYGSEMPPSVSIEPGGHEFFPAPIVEFFDQHLRR